VDLKIFGYIYAIEPSVEVSTRTLQVRAIAENKDGKLLPGTLQMLSCLLMLL
jgi:membrane fusion protein (multidrug efflux system)